MIGKLKKGSSFGGCIRYVTGKDEAKIIASDGVLLGTNAEITQSFELQRQLNPRIKKPVGHIALSFKPEDKPSLTDEFMAKIALEYMQMMGITKNQFIIVRHHNTDNPHCHIVYNRINNEGKLISDRNDYRRNEQVTKALKSRYGLTYGTDKSKTNTRKLRSACSLRLMPKLMSHSQRMNPPRRKRGNAERASAFDASYKLKNRIEHERRTIGSHLRHS